MSQVEIGVMIGMLSGDKETVEAFQVGLGKKIAKLWLGDDDALHFRFEDGTGIKLFDDDQSCCEHRYMRTDDDLEYYIGSVLQSAEVRDAPSMVEDDYGEHEVRDAPSMVEDDYGEHEVAFLEVVTSKGSFTMSNHNEHNGYYGGFCIVCRQESED